MWLSSLGFRLKEYWNILTAPSPKITEGQERQRASLVTGLSLALLVLGSVVVVSWVAVNPQFTSAPSISIILILGLGVVFILSRSPLYSLAAGLFVYFLVVMIVVVILAFPGPTTEQMLALNFFIVAILLASLLLSIRQTLVVFSICLMVTSAFLFVPSVPFEITYTYLVFLSLTSSLLLLVSILRNRYIRQLRDSQKRYLALFNQSNDAVFIIDLAGSHIEINQSAADMLGYSQEEAQKLSFRDIVAPSEVELGESVLERLLANEHLPIYERTFRRKDGTEFPVEVNVELVLDNEGEPLHIQSIVREISERKKAEEALKESEARFRHLTIQSPDTIYIFNLQTNEVEFINDKLFLGYSLGELQLAGSVPNQVHPEDRARVIEYWQRIVEDKEPARAVDYRFRHKEGHWEWIHNRGIVLTYTEDEEPLEILVVLTVITDSKKAEDRLRVQEEYLRILIEQTPIGIVTVDMTGHITDANPRSLEILGSPDPYLSTRPNLLTVPDLMDRKISRMLEKALSKGEMAEMETWYTSSWGKTVFLLLRIVPHFDGKGTQIGLIILVEDLTERVQAEEGMRRMQKFEGLSVLAGGIAHDFNNLLVAILGQTSLAQAKLRPGNPGRPHIDRAVSAAERASQLTQQLLAYSGQGHIRVAHLDMNALIEENLHLFAASIPKHIHLETNLAEDLPAVKVDIAQIQQVVMNLIINAVEAFDDKMGTISIMTDIQFVAAKDYKSRQFSMTPSEDGDYVTLEIRDDGIGMNKETLANIFDPFFTTKEKGHGLGLAAVLGIIKGHNGGLMVTSEVGVGTTFKILLPASTDYEADDLEHPSTRSLNGAGLVLVIDDEPHVRMAVSDILKLKNIKSILASDGQQGLALYQEHQKEVGLVLLDLSMPGWSGEQTMRELYKFDPDVSIILSSGYNEVEATRLFVGDGLVGFLQKPYSAAKLLDTVANYIG